MLESLTLENFKSFRKATVPLGPFTLLVGANASGKSNIRDALRFLHGVGLGFSLGDIFGDKYGPSGILQWLGTRGGSREAIRHGEAAFKLAATMRTQDGAIEYALTVGEGPSKGELGVTQEHLRGETGTVIDWMGANGQSTHCRSPKLAEVALENGIAAIAQRGLSLMRFLDFDPDAARRPSAAGQVVLGDHGENLSSVLQKICSDEKSHQALLSWLHHLAPVDAVGLEFKKDLVGRVMLFLRDVHGHETSAWSASDGTLRFLALAAALMTADRGTLYFLEDLDSGIHPVRMRLLVQLIEQTCATYGLQVVATTHSPPLLMYLSEAVLGDALLVYRVEGTSDSRVRRIMDLPDIKRVLAGHDIEHLFMTGWFEHAADFAESEEAEGSGDDA